MSSVAKAQSYLHVALDQGYTGQKVLPEIYDQDNKTAMIISGLIKYLCTKQTK